VKIRCACVCVCVCVRVCVCVCDGEILNRVQSTNNASIVEDRGFTMASEIDLLASHDGTHNFDCGGECVRSESIAGQH
jgi:hypothetical protein